MNQVNQDLYSSPFCLPVENHEVRVLLPSALFDDGIWDKAEWVAMRVAFVAALTLYHHVARGGNILTADEDLKLVVLLVVPLRRSQTVMKNVSLETMVQGVEILRNAYELVDRDKIYKELRWELGEETEEKFPRLFKTLVEWAVDSLPVEVRVVGNDEHECRELAEQWNALVEEEEGHASVQVLDVQQLKGEEDGEHVPPAFF